MGEIYTVMPLGDEARAWVKAEGLSAPDEAGRWPSPTELRAVLEALEGYQVSYRDRPDGGWDAEVVDRERGNEGLRATLWVNAADDPTEPGQFSFHKPSPELALLILRALSEACGPFVVVAASSMKTVVVTRECDVALSLRGF